jgi:tetratricopeptide (TPR) repeat protein
MKSIHRFGAVYVKAFFERRRWAARTASRLAIRFVVWSCFISSVWCWPVVAQEARWKELHDQFLNLYEHGKYAEALPVAEEDLRIAKTTFGSDDPNTATSLNNVALLYTAIGRYMEAEPLCKQALAIDEKATGPTRRYVAEDLNNLGWLYSLEGRYSEAEQLYNQAMTILRDALGPDTAEVVTPLNNLAQLYATEGRYEDDE